MSGSDVLDKKQTEILNQFRNAVSDILKPEHDDDYLLRWLKARDFNVSKAEKMIRKSFKSMYNLGAVDILKTDFKVPHVMETYVPNKFWGFDYEGSPVRFFGTGRLDWKGFYRSLTSVELLQILVYFMELDMQRAREHAGKTGKKPNLPSVYVLDYTNLSLLQLLDKVVINKSILLLESYQDNFPELLKAAFVINVPPFFYILISALKPFLSEKTFKKIRIFSTDGWKEELAKQMDPKIIPACYGGDRDDPDYDPSIFFANKSTVPLTLYVEEDSYLKSTDPGITTIVIPEKQTYDHNVNIQNPGASLQWTFQTKAYDVKFGILFKENQGNSNPYVEEIVKPELVNPVAIPQRGQHLCEKTGEYILHFDNTFSRFTKKTVLLKIEIQEPVTGLIPRHIATQ